jgi:hypothetical protein
MIYEILCLCTLDFKKLTDQPLESGRLGIPKLMVQTIKVNLPSVVAFMALAFLQKACAVSSNQNFILEFNQDVSVSTEGLETKNVKQGESISLPLNAILVSRPAFKSLILLPVPANPGLIKVKLPLDDAGSGAIANQIMRAVFDVQRLLLDNKADEALTRIQSLKDKYLGFSYLSFLEASCYAVKRDFSKAKEIAEATLKEFPDDESARSFLKDLDLVK